MVFGCQTCLRVMKDSSEGLYLNSVSSGSDTIPLEEKLADCVPELILDSVQNAVLCHPCVESLTLAYQFKQSCLEAQQKIYGFLQQVPDSIQTDVGKIAAYYQRLEIIAQGGDPTIDDSSNVIINHAEEPHSCKWCPFSCLHESVLRQHKILHKNKAPPYKCDQCSFIFPTAVLLLDHLASHSNERPYSCTLCDFVAASHSALKMHGWCHRKAFQCNICWKRFAQKSELDGHVELHSCVLDARPFQCGLCEFKCDTVQTLSAHTDNHHQHTYNCKTCKIKCRTKLGLLQHTKRIHKESAAELQKNAVCEDINHHLNDDVIIVPDDVIIVPDDVVIVPDDDNENNKSGKGSEQSKGPIRSIFVCLNCSLDCKSLAAFKDHFKSCGVDLQHSQNQEFLKNPSGENQNRSSVLGGTNRNLYSLFEGINRSDSASDARGSSVSNLLANANMNRQLEGVARFGNASDMPKNISKACQGGVLNSSLKNFRIPKRKHSTGHASCFQSNPNLQPSNNELQNSLVPFAVANNTTPNLKIPPSKYGGKKLRRLNASSGNDIGHENQDIDSNKSAVQTIAIPEKNVGTNVPLTSSQQNIQEDSQSNENNQAITQVQGQESMVVETGSELGSSPSTEAVLSGKSKKRRRKHVQRVKIHTGSGSFIRMKKEVAVAMGLWPIQRDPQPGTIHPTNESNQECSLAFGPYMSVQQSTGDVDVTNVQEALDSNASPLTVVSANNDVDPEVTDVPKHIDIQKDLQPVTIDPTNGSNQECALAFGPNMSVQQSAGNVAVIHVQEALDSNPLPLIVVGANNDVDPEVIHVPNNMDVQKDPRPVTIDPTNGSNQERSLAFGPNMSVQQSTGNVDVINVQKASDSNAPPLTIVGANNAVDHQLTNVPKLMNIQKDPQPGTIHPINRFNQECSLAFGPNMSVQQSTGNVDVTNVQGTLDSNAPPLTVVGANNAVDHQVTNVPKLMNIQKDPQPGTIHPINRFNQECSLAFGPNMSVQQSTGNVDVTNVQGTLDSNAPPLTVVGANNDVDHQVTNVPKLMNIQKDPQPGTIHPINRFNQERSLAFGPNMSVQQSTGNVDVTNVQGTLDSNAPPLTVGANNDVDPEVIKVPKNIQTTDLLQNINANKNLDVNIQNTINIPQNTKTKVPDSISKCIPCRHCSLVLNSKSGLRNHRRTAHRDVIANTKHRSPKYNAQEASITNLQVVADVQATGLSQSKYLDISGRPDGADIEHESLDKCASNVDGFEVRDNDRVAKVPDHLGLKSQTTYELKNIFINKVNLENNPIRNASGFSKKRKLEETETNAKLNIDVLENEERRDDMTKLDEKFRCAKGGNEDTLQMTRASDNMGTRDFPPTADQNLSNNTPIGNKQEENLASIVEYNVDVNRLPSTNATDQNSDANNPVVLDSNSQSLTISQSVAAPNLDDIKKRYPCVWCSVIFKTYAKLCYHVKHVHKHTMEQWKSLRPPQICKKREIDKNAPKKVYKCKLCPHESESRGLRYFHLVMVHRVGCMDMQASHSNSQLDSSVQDPNINITDGNANLGTNVGMGDGKSDMGSTSKDENSATILVVGGDENVTNKSVAVEHKNADTTVVAIKQEKMDVNHGGSMYTSDLCKNPPDVAIPSTSNVRVKLENFEVATCQAIKEEVFDTADMIDSDQNPDESTLDIKQEILDIDDVV